MLGPLEARVEGVPVGLGGPKQRALVALLLLQANDVVPLDRLIDELWEGAPPPSAPAYVQNCVSRLRKLLGAETFETRAPGYRLRIDPEAIDVGRFERLVLEARGMPTRERAGALREALGLWAGTPLSDLAYWSFAQDPIRRLEEQRLNALEMRLEAELELGLHRESIGELDALAREHPTHERLRWLQMLALHRSDRRLDALAAYQEARLAIVEESGMEPGEELRALQRRILQDDPTLMPDGAPAEVAERPPQLARKVVAVCIVELLVDEELDVEAARGVVSRGLASLEEIVLRHGGAVEQLLGEEAVAVFGLPAAHEDDALRAMRSAVELRDALGAVTMRAAVETGEVLVGENGRVLSGGALTTARRVKEGATEGEILVGPTAAAQTTGAAWTEPSSGAHRLLELVEGASAIPRRPDAALVGRRAELELLVLAVRQSASEASCRRVVVVGEPGVGKTRLAAELVATVAGEARVLTGRCVPYADGATYLPLADVVGQVAGEGELGAAIHAVLDGEQDGEQAAARLVDALSGRGAVDSGDVSWAARKLLEALARQRPVVVVLEDVHWAEPTFLDLLEYLVGWSKGAPITLVCLARPELLDARPAWAADSIPLRPLTEEETADLLDELPESLALDADARAAVIAAAEGNPLFLEQLAAHALDGPLEAGRVPASLESLLASRLDSLGPRERVVLERAAVVGREFTRAAVDALALDETRGTTATALMALVRRRLVRPDTERADDDAFLFDHALIRDATYAAIAKAERGRLHEQLARWLDRKGELDEIVGHHLEQAALNRHEAGDDATGLAGEASDVLDRAGMAALKRDDANAALSLLTRAVGLLSETDRRWLERQCKRGVALKFTGDYAGAEELLTAVVERARERADPHVEHWASVELVWPRISRGVLTMEEGFETVEHALGALTDIGDDFVLARVWHARAARLADVGRLRDSEEAAAVSGHHYRRAGAGDAAGSIQVASAVVHGPTSVPRALEVCSRLVERSETPAWRSFILPFMALLDAMEGRFDVARERLEEARVERSEFPEAGTLPTVWANLAARVELLAGDAVASERILTEACDELRRAGANAWLATNAALLGESLYRQDRLGAAMAVVDEALQLGIVDDLAATPRILRVRGKLLARAGKVVDGERCAREAIGMLGRTDMLDDRAGAFGDLAEALGMAGDVAGASSALTQAADLFEQKGNEVSLAQTRRFLGERA